MKKIAIWALAALAVFAISCKKNNTDSGSEEEPVGLSSSALVGEWSISDEFFSNTWTFTSDQFTVIAKTVKAEGSYEVEDDTIVFTLAKTWYKDYDYDDYGNRVYGDWEESDAFPEGQTFNIKAKLLYDGSVLILDLSVLLEEGPDGPIARSPFISKSPEEPFDPENMLTLPFSYFVYKTGATPPSDTGLLQGVWDWNWVYPTETHICVRITFEGNNYELIVTPYAAKVTGSYTYKDGWVTCNISALYSAFDLNSDEWGDDAINPVTLEATWYLIDPENEDYPEDFPTEVSFPFIADGEFAYSVLTGIPIKYDKNN
jgi:hypothetical protein